VELSAGREPTDEVAATKTMINRTARRFDMKPKRLAWGYVEN
jgi:hypothetical protein